ncbi:leucine-rich repeat domain-containing protein [Wenyingzhuangia sp. IMCC45467]
MKLKLLLTCLLTFAFAKAEYFESNGIRYNTTDTNTVEVVALSSGKYTGAITIPDTVVYNAITYTVTGIGNAAFYQNEELTSIIFPTGLLYIGQNGFLSCKKLTNFTLPAGFTRLGSTAFYGCLALTSVVIPDGVTEIKDQTFEGCSNLVSVAIPSGVTSIEREAFNGCSSLASITLPAGLTEIIENTFSGCESLTTITLPNSITTIGDSAFEGCSDLEKVQVENATPFTIGEDVFSDISSLAYLLVPSGSVSAYEGADGWSDFSVITSTEARYFVANGIRYLSFDGTTVSVVPLDSENKYEGDITIPSSVINESVTYSVTKIAKNTFYENEELTSVTISNGVTTIGDSAFEDCTDLSSIILPAGLTGISDNLFSGCESLTSITLPSGVTTIGEQAFFETGLTAISLPSGVTSLGFAAFAFCTKIESITLPSGVTSILDYCFYGCSSLSEVIVENPTPVVFGSGAGVFTDIDSNAVLTVPQGAKSDYESATLWQDFTTINEMTTLSVEERVFDDNLTIEMNQNTLVVYANSDIVFKEINLYSINGAVVKVNHQSTIDISMLSKGIYILNISTNKGVFTKKVIKQ